MGTAERREKERTIRLDDIVDAAERVFFEKDGQDATMDDVAREADFSKRTLYKYFSSKDSLMLAISLRGYRALNLMLEKTMADVRDGNAMERLEAYGRTYVEFRDRYPGHFTTILAYRTLESDLSGTDPIATQCYQEGEKPTGLIEATIREGILDGSVRADIDPVEASIVLWADLVGLLLILERKTAYLASYRHVEVGKLIDAAFLYIRRSIGCLEGAIHGN